MSFFLHPDDPECWGWRDRLLALAYEEHLAGLHSCGHPSSLAFSMHSDGHYKVQKVICNACAASDSSQRHAGNESMPGEREHVVNLMEHREPVRAWDGQPLGAD